MTRLGSPLASAWTLRPDAIFLNHGSFGACPRAVQDAQQAWRARMEEEPVLFLDREMEPRWDHARDVTAAFVGARPRDLVFVANATTAVNAVLRSLAFRPGDELLTTRHAYNACRNVLDHVAAQHGASVVVAEVPFPVRSPGEVTESILSCCTARTRLALVDHVTSPTALVFPVAEIVQALQARGVEVLVDGAHAPGMVPLDVTALGAEYYTGNLHKWVCGPKGAAFLHVREDRQAAIRPTTLSHGANAVRRDRPRFLLEFDWTGTSDATAVLTVPAALEFMAGVVEGGWPALMQRNHALAVEARDILLGAVGGDAPCPADMLGSMASVRVADGPAEAPLDGAPRDPLHLALWEQTRIEVPVFPFPRRPARLLRVSAQVYNSREQYLALADALRGLNPRGAR